MNNYDKRIKGLSALIGNTPLLEISFKYKKESRKIYTKAENFNFTGSIKDRMAFHIIEKAYKKGLLNSDSVIIEVTSGNTGISFSAIGRALGYRVIIFMPNWMSQERINLIKGFGAEIILISKEEGGFLGGIAKSEDLSKHMEHAFLSRQFSNEDNIEAHYQTTGPEIWWQLKFRSVVPEAFIAGVGTGGTIMGAGRFLKEKNPNIKLHPLEPSNSPTLSTGHKVGSHRIQGISDEFIPAILNLSSLDSVISVDDGDAIIMAQKLAYELGIGVGISSGANFIGAIMVQNELGSQAIVVTVFPDDNKKYLSTDLFRQEPRKNNFISSDVEFLGFKALKRVCYTCCDPEQCLENGIKIKEIKLPKCPMRE